VQSIMSGEKAGEIVTVPRIISFLNPESLLATSVEIM
jgi:hypothetical protein